MESQAVIQVLSKADYTEQQLVALPNIQREPLHTSCVRVKSTLLALTTNNLTPTPGWATSSAGGTCIHCRHRRRPRSMTRPSTAASQLGALAKFLESNVANVPERIPALRLSTHRDPSRGSAGRIVLRSKGPFSRNEPSSLTSLELV
jgi:hypothetical protein